MGRQPQGIIFGQRAPTLSFTPDDVLGGDNPVVTSPLRRSRRSVAVAPAPTSAVELHQRYVDSTHVPTPADQRMELDRARTLNALIAQQQRERAHTQKQLSGAALAESLGALDVRDPQYAVKSAKLFSQYADGADTQAAKEIAALKHSEFTAFNTAYDNHQQAVAHATLTKRVAPLLGSDQVPSDLKNKLVNDDGSFNAAAIAQAEALHSSGGGKAGDEFYSKLQKDHGLTRSDLDYVVANPGSDQQPGAVKYMGADGPASADAVKGKEKDFRAVAELPNGGTLNLPLTTFNNLVSTHKNLNRPGSPSADALTAQEQLFKDRAVMEATLAAEGLTPRSATPAGYDKWKAQQPPPYKPTPASAGNDLPVTDYGNGAVPTPAPNVTPAPAANPIDFLKKALGTASAAAPVAAASSGLPDQADEELDA